MSAQELFRSAGYIYKVSQDFTSSLSSSKIHCNYNDKLSPMDAINTPPKLVRLKLRTWSAMRPRVRKQQQTPREDNDNAENTTPATRAHACAGTNPTAVFYPHTC